MQITGITEADGIGDNLVDVMFSILDTSDPASPQSLHSTAVSESFEQANVNEISGYTVSNLTVLMYNEISP